MATPIPCQVKFCTKYSGAYILHLGFEVTYAIQLKLNLMEGVIKVEELDRYTLRLYIAICFRDVVTPSSVVDFVNERLL